MGKDDINILFAVCIAIIMLIACSFSKNQKDEKIINAEAPDAVEETQEQTTD